MQEHDIHTPRIQAKVPCEFWRGPVIEKARNALGMVLARRDAGITLRGRIVEVEAYGGSDDPASPRLPPHDPAQRGDVWSWRRCVYLLHLRHAPLP